MTEVLVTGGAGFIGSQLVDRLLAGGAHVVAVDNLVAGKEAPLRGAFKNPRFKFIRGDAGSPELLRKVLPKVKMVYHLAAQPDVRVSHSDPEADFQANVVTTWRLLRSMVDTGIRGLVFFSSSTVYGEPRLIPTPEDYSPLLPIWAYGTSKLCCESLVQGFAQTHDMRVAVIRPANVIGPRATHGVIPDLLSKLAASPRKIEILGDGEQRKSYVYISDFLDGLALASAELSHRASPVNVFNIGNETSMPVRAVAETVARSCGYDGVDITPKARLPRGRGWPGDVTHSWLDISKLRKLGWKPRHSCEQAVALTAQELSKESDSDA